MLARWKYLLAFAAATSAWIAMTAHGAWTFLPLFVYFGLVPGIELALGPRPENLDGSERERAEGESGHYDRLLYAVAPFQLATLALFLVQVQEPGLAWYEIVGRTLSMGVVCGALGINAGHDLGHRKDKLARRLGDLCLLTSLENHFTVYHDRGHHRNVGTPEDPATARRGESLYAFMLRSQPGSWRQAWRIERERLAARGVPEGTRAWFLANRMVVYTALQVTLLALVGLLAGPLALGAFVGAALFGIALLETVNYIEHYGLVRERRADGRRERVRHHHSWNSDHPIGRALLFELSRHSDHHYKSGKPYQLLDSLPESPQMPTGYPGMMLLAAVPPLWRRVMHPRLDGFGARRASRGEDDRAIGAA